MQPKTDQFFDTAILVGSVFGTLSCIVDPNPALVVSSVFTFLYDVSNDNVSLSQRVISTAGLATGSVMAYCCMQTLRDGLFKGSANWLLPLLTSTLTAAFFHIMRLIHNELVHIRTTPPPEEPQIG